jgi:UDP-N-acetylmuramoyl-tripeptide--D-alanyl-D-alanine ligase
MPRGGRAEPNAPPALTAGRVATLTGGRLLLDSARPIRGAAVDSRLVQPGELFVALPGERTDGHAFVGDAVARGAACVLVSRPPSDIGALGGASLVQVRSARR